MHRTLPGAKKKPFHDLQGYDCFYRDMIATKLLMEEEEEKEREKEAKDEEKEQI